MFIRKTTVKKARDGDKSYTTYRIVETERLGQKVKQRTLLNLGNYFDVDSTQWPWLCARIEQILTHQVNLFGDDLQLEPSLEAAAQRYAALILHKQSQCVPISQENGANSDAPSNDYQCVNVNQLEVCRPRSIGVESITYHAIEQLELPQCLSALGFNSKHLAAAMGHIVGRLASPGSERHTQQWLQHQSGLGELLYHDFDTTSLTRMYEVADKLYYHRNAIERHLCQREVDLFALERRIILYDLTNTYFEGQASNNPQAKFGRSKEKRSDCPLVTLGLVVDGEGFPLCSRTFPGNVSEPETLEKLLDQLCEYQACTEASGQKPIVVMDAGIATKDNLTWLRTRGYRYIVVSRDRDKQPPQPEQGIVVKDAPGKRVIVEKVIDESAQEVRVYCHSEGKAKKEQAIQTSFNERFEGALRQLNEGLSKKGCIKRYDKILERIGRLKQKYSRVSRDYRIDVNGDDKLTYAKAIDWHRNSTQKEASLGVYCLRSNILDWQAESLWRTYVMLTEVEATFRSLKTDFGLRPVYHQKETRVSAHLFISLLAYHVAHTLRFQLKAKGIHLSWSVLRQQLSTQQRVTVSLPTKDQNTIHVRTTSRAETQQQVIYDALGLATDRLGKCKTLIHQK